jgi:hypothetical protein
LKRNTTKLKYYTTYGGNPNTYQYYQYYQVNLKDKYYKGNSNVKYYKIEVRGQRFG